MSTTSVGTATVMFTDLAGSTEIRSRLGEDAADALRAVHDAILNDAIAANGGRVVKHLGDGLMAAFTSAAGAVAAAVALQQEIDRANRRALSEPLRVRVGISTGDVTFDGDDCFGLPVVEAQRLEASAEPGTIRCAEMVKLLARGRGGHEFVALGDLDLKGLAEPLRACQVLWAPLDDQLPAGIELGLPPVFAHRGGLPFSGRDEVFEQLVDAWNRCVTGGFEVVLLAGEPGIGKTRLAQELATRVHGGEGVVLAGRCDEDVAVPFQAFGAALDWFLRQTPADQRLAKLGAYPGDLARLVPDLGQRVADLPASLRHDADTERFRLFQAVGSWLSIGDVQRPRLLVIDDLHWADKPTLLLLRHLISNPPTGLLVLCTYRDTDVDRTHPLSAMLADFRRMPAVTRLAVGGLDGEGIRDLLVRTGGHELDEAGLAFADLVERETSGNPFFVGEVLRHLAETGALAQREGRWVSDLRPSEANIPEGIREVVGRRLSRLGDGVEQVLRAAAVIGCEFELDLLATVVGSDPDGVLDALDTAAAASLVVEVGVGRHRFAHALVRETLHGELSASRRARQHRKVAEAIEALHARNIDAVVAELATHWAEASAGGDPARAIEFAVRAGAQATERGAWENAERWYQSALELIDTDDSFDLERRQVLVALATVQAQSGAIERARRTVVLAANAAIAYGDIDCARAALTIRLRSSFDAGDGADPDKLALVRRALAMPGLSISRRADLLAQLATELIFVRDVPGRRAALDELWARMPSLGAEDHARLFQNAGLVEVRSSTASRDFVDLIDGALAVARPDEVARLLISRFFSALRIGDARGAEGVLTRAVAEFAANPNALSWMPFCCSAMLAVINGELDRADADVGVMVHELEKWAVPEANNYRTTTGLMIGRERRSLPEMAWLVDVMEQMGHPSGAARAMAAFISLSVGDPERAVQALDLVQFDEFADDAGRSISVALWSEVAGAIGSTAQRRSLLELLVPQAGVHFGTGGIYLGTVDRLRALLHDRLGEFDEADVLFDAAVVQHETMCSPTWTARTRLEWAESLIARGDHVAAAQHLQAAADAIGDRTLPDNQLRLGELRARVNA